MPHPSRRFVPSATGLEPRLPLDGTIAPPPLLNPVMPPDSIVIPVPNEWADGTGGEGDWLVPDLLDPVAPPDAIILSPDASLLDGWDGDVNDGTEALPLPWPLPVVI